MSEGKKKKEKKTALFIFLRNIPQCLCRRNKKNNHNFKVLIFVDLYFFSKRIKRMAVGHDDDETY
jgi:hypothetical protein